MDDLWVFYANEVVSPAPFYANEVVSSACLSLIGQLCLCLSLIGQLYLRCDWSEFKLQNLCALIGQLCLCLSLIGQL